MVLEFVLDMYGSIQIFLYKTLIIYGRTWEVQVIEVT